VIFHFKCLKANLRGGKGGTFLVGPGRHLALLRHWVATLVRTNTYETLKHRVFGDHILRMISSAPSNHIDSELLLALSIKREHSSQIHPRIAWRSCVSSIFLPLNELTRMNWNIAIVISDAERTFSFNAGNSTCTLTEKPVTACLGMFVSERLHQNRNVNCTFGRFVRQAKDKSSNRGFHLKITGKVQNTSNNLKEKRLKLQQIPQSSKIEFCMSFICIQAMHREVINL